MPRLLRSRRRPRSNPARSFNAEKKFRTTLEVPVPVIVAEVLSPGTEATDMRDKLHGYFTLRSVRHYLIVDPDKRMVIHHARGSGDALQTRLLTSGPVTLEPPGLSIETFAFFE
jgi:Uma2 family endonuclease